MSVKGAIQAQEVVVTANLPDYVFSSDYSLRSLEDVESYIEANHHLPEIPSAAQALKKGVSIGEMQTKLLAKIEELTLYMIRMQEDNKQL